MDIIVWSDEYSVGIEKIDCQHKNIIRLINTLSTVSNLNINSEAFSEALDKMNKYIGEHLNYEETLLLEADYPDFNHHKELHDRYSEVVADLAFDAISGNEKAPFKLLNFLKIWWKNHILIEDKIFSDHLKAKGIS